VDEAFENEPAIVAAQHALARAFRMRHEPGDVAALVANPGDVKQRTVRVGFVGQFALGVRILPENLVSNFKQPDRFFIGKIATLAVGDGNAEQFAVGDAVRERGIGGDRLEENMLATELERAVADERAGQQPRFAKNLETVADAQHQPAVGRERLHGLHDGAETRNRAGAQIIAVAETAGHDHGVGIAERGFLVPEEPRGMAAHVAQNVQRVLVAVGGGKLENGEIHF